MFGRLRALLGLILLIVVVGACASVSTPEPTCPGLPGCNGAGTPPPNLRTTTAPVTEMLTVMVGDAAKTYPAVCAIAEGSSIVVNGRYATGTATFSWVGKETPQVSGTILGTAFTGSDLSASVSFMSQHAWSFSGMDSVSGKALSGSAICK